MTKYSLYSYCPAERRRAARAVQRERRADHFEVRVHPDLDERAVREVHREVEVLLPQIERASIRRG